MAIIKCKMCGGDLDISEGLSVCECEYCGTKQTVPSADDEKKLTLFARANRLRLANEFDKASSVYESIVADFPEEAEAYWGLVLCKYGIEYVDDSATGRKVPTCHRVSFDSVLEDTDFDQACENADAIARRQYREEAKQFEDIRRGIIEVSGKEEPYDVFICYKESDDSGDRTVDSVIAQDVYDALTAKGYRVFFSRISLEDKLGTEYEPYIFAALNSAKVMLAFGTDYEYYNAVWVKNEWSRFLKLMEKDKSKHLIPCYKNLDPYDMPKEFQRLQGQDMGKVGAVQDLLRGIEKLLPKAEEKQPLQQQVTQSGGPNVTALLKRGYMSLEDKRWDKAKEFFDQVLSMDAENPDAYLGIVLANEELSDLAAFRLAYSERRVSDSPELTRARAFANADQTVWWRQNDEALSTADERKLQELKAKAAALQPLRQKLAPMKVMLSACGNQTVGLKVDGTVVAVGDNDKGQRNVSDWKDIVAVSASESHTVGLMTDGTVVAVGDNEYGECNVSGWKEVVSIIARSGGTVGLKTDGTVVVVGHNESGRNDVSDWRDIVAVSASGMHTVGLRADGTVVATGYNEDGQCNVSDWKEIVDIAAGYQHTVGLKSNGTVFAVGDDSGGQCAVSDWKDIVAVSAGGWHTVGLKADGTVVAVGSNKFIRQDYGHNNVSSWRNIVAIAAGVEHTVGLKTNGTLVAVGDDAFGQCSISAWRLFRDAENLERERKEATLLAERKRIEKEKAAALAEARRREAETREAAEIAEMWEEATRAATERVKQAEIERRQRIADLNTEQSALRIELSKLKGLFTGKRRKEIENRLAQIAKELDKSNRTQ